MCSAKLSQNMGECRLPCMAKSTFLVFFNIFSWILPYQLLGFLAFGFLESGPFWLLASWLFGFLAFGFWLFGFSAVWLFGFLVSWLLAFGFSAFWLFGFLVSWLLAFWLFGFWLYFFCGFGFRHPQHHQ